MTELPIFADLTHTPPSARAPGRAELCAAHESARTATCGSVGGEDERDLVERAKRDPEAFATLYRRHYAAIASYVFRRLGDVHATEDVVADVFLTAMRSLPRYRYRGAPIRAWLYRIASRAAGRWAKRHRRRIVRQLEQDWLEGGAEREPLEAGRDQAERARLAMLSLSPKHQAVLSLHYLEGMAAAEVAAVIGCRIGTVKSRLSRAREALRERLSQGRSCHARR